MSFWLLLFFGLFVAYRLALIATRRTRRTLPYSATIPNTKTEGSGDVTRSWRTPPPRALPTQLGNISTLYEILEHANATYGPRRFCGVRNTVRVHGEEIANSRGQMQRLIKKELTPFNYLTFNQFHQRVSHYASGLAKLGLKTGDKLGLYDETRFEWTLAEHGCFRQGIVVVTVYSNLGEDALVHAIKEGPIEILQTNGANLKILASLIGRCPSLRRIIYVDEADAASISTLTEANVQLFTLQQIEESGSQEVVAAAPPSPDQLAVIMYTSGSTGVPKGVMISHSNMVGALAGVTQLVDLSPNDVYLSFLPLAHVLALVVENALIWAGATIGYGTPRTLIDAQVVNCRGDLSELRPTLMAGVPAIYDRIKSNAMQKINHSGFLKFLWKIAFEQKRQAILKGEATPFWDFLVFNKAKASLGGRLRFALTGGAALSPEAHEWLRVVFGCPILQGYGLTETCGAGSLQEQDDYTTGNTGAPVPSVEIKLVDVPEMNYISAAPVPRGEIWIRGPSVTRGYYKNENQTLEAYKPDGWFATGDIGQWQENGCLKIIDRKKNLIKPPHGEYIAIERLESEYKNCPLVHNIMVYVDSDHNPCLAFINPEPNALRHWAQTKGLNTTDHSQICANPQLNDFFLKSLADVAKQNRLTYHEGIKAVHVDSEEWSPENGLLTAALKLNRQPLVARFRPRIAEMYAALEPK